MNLHQVPNRFKDIGVQGDSAIPQAAINLLDTGLHSWKIKNVTMSKKAANPRNFVYPASTAGSEAAKRLRAEANKLSEQQRDDLFKRGMQIIYGGPGTKKTLGSRH